MKQITCINCPISCRINVDVEHGAQVFTGNKCNKGASFAKNELTAPDRTLTTIVKTAFPDMPVLSVRTSGKIPKKKIASIIRKLSKIIITERKCIGEIIVSNICRTGCNIIATSDMSGINTEAS